MSYERVYPHVRRALYALYNSDSFLEFVGGISSVRMVGAFVHGCCTEEYPWRVFPFLCWIPSKRVLVDSRKGAQMGRIVPLQVSRATLFVVLGWLALISGCTILQLVC